MTYISVEELIRRIISICHKHPSLLRMDASEVGIQYNNGILSHIWLHCYSNDGERAFRVAYEKPYRGGDNYILNHYMWKNGKGWTLIGQLKSQSIDNYRPNTF